MISISGGAQAIFNNDASNLADYGRLYNWYAVDDARGLCLSGWHVPTDEEFMTLEMALGMSEVEAESTGWRGTDQGSQMKTDYGWLDWLNAGNGTNSSGFSGLPGGFRRNDGNFYDNGSGGIWWSSSPDGANSWFRHMFHVHENVFRGTDNLRTGFSVRCIKD
ncbi:fibrobacter succinogenes major paralogous domain-containing protein [Flavobacteriales bacterium]|nr:fibrobacter succinogenes major paralogous domain-containing protein [Flavobacteriales bacterium]